MRGVLTQLLAREGIEMENSGQNFLKDRFSSIVDKWTCSGSFILTFILTFKIILRVPPRGTTHMRLKNGKTVDMAIL